MLMDYRTKLQQIIVASGLSQQSLAEKIGTSFVTLNNWLNGKSVPTRSNLIASIDTLYLEFVGTDSVDLESLSVLKNQAQNRRLSVRALMKNKNLLDELTLSLTYNTNTIEGSTMTRSDVAAVLFNDEVLSNRTQVEQREAVNHRVALEYLLDELYANAELKFSAEFIQKTHLLLMNGVLSNAGVWRNHGVRIQGSRVVLANYTKIPDLIGKLCAELNSETDDPVALLAHTHATFEQIHPFSDGNGRTGRLLMFIKSLQLGIVPPVVAKERKMVYYRYLELAQTRGRYDSLEQFIAETIIATGDDVGI